MKKLILILILSSFYLHAATYNIIASDVTWTASGAGGYNIWDSTSYDQDITIQIDYTVLKKDSYIICFTAGGSGVYTSRTAYY